MGPVCQWDHLVASFQNILNTPQTKKPEKLHCNCFWKVLLMVQSDSGQWIYISQSSNCPTGSRVLSSVFATNASSLPLSHPLQRPHHGHALFDFTPHHPTQLRFLRGDVIELLDCSDPLRWRGRCHGHVGFFPPEYVQPIYHCQWPTSSPSPTHLSKRQRAELRCRATTPTHPALLPLPSFMFRS